MTTGDLKRIDSRPIPENREEVRAFMVAWNESLRLDSTLKHYRQIGVNRFFVVDSGSTDGTLDYLAAAPDVHVYSAAGDDGIAWINALLDTFGSGHWTLTVDADELFIYPHYEQLELPFFCRYLNYVGSQAVPCVSLDMYAANPVRDAVHRQGTPLLDTCRYFDAAPYRMVQTQDSPYFEIHGGVRERAFSQTAANPPPVLSRVPLVRWQAGMRYLRGTGNITPVIMANVLAALLRFEFLSDFAERAQSGVALSEGLSTNLYCDSSVRFENSAQLVQLGLMKTARAYEESVQLTAAARSARSA
jgi:glycosyltransferase involved in cell wall biosynthesis